ncbi:unnamed protein product [Chrysoparadoxa australica]
MDMPAPVFGSAEPTDAVSMDLVAGLFDDCFVELNGDSLSIDQAFRTDTALSFDMEGVTPDQALATTSAELGLPVAPAQDLHGTTPAVMPATMPHMPQGVSIGLQPVSAPGGWAKPEQSSSMVSKKRKAQEDDAGSKDLTEAQKLERRERNREHAKRSRVRKKFMLECLQEELLCLRKENMNLRQLVQEEMPDIAADLLAKYTSEKAVILSGRDASHGEGAQVDNSDDDSRPLALLQKPDFQLMRSLRDSQRCFTVSDPSLPDNPIVYASQGFLDLTGYSAQQVVGSNCRFLQGAGTDPKALAIIRKGVAEGRDTCVCLLNYKADGTPFWNQFFVAALRNDQGTAVHSSNPPLSTARCTLHSLRLRIPSLILTMPMLTLTLRSLCCYCWLLPLIRPDS